MNHLILRSQLVALYGFCAQRKSLPDVSEDKEVQLDSHRHVSVHLATSNLICSIRGQFNHIFTLPAKHFREETHAHTFEMAGYVLVTVSLISSPKILPCIPC